MKELFRFMTFRTEHKELAWFAWLWVFVWLSLTPLVIWYLSNN